MAFKVALILSDSEPHFDIDVNTDKGHAILPSAVRKIGLDSPTFLLSYPQAEFPK